jgi:hypothetical protein
VAYFEAISARIFEKNRIITWRFAVVGAFDIATSSTTYNFSQSIHLLCALRPKCDARLIGNVAK